MSLNSFNAKAALTCGDKKYTIFRLDKAGDVSRLPFSLKILLENLLRNEDGVNVTKADIEALARWKPGDRSEREILFMPARVILQDFTGVPCVVDLASLRDAVAEMGGDPKKINPLQPVDLVIDHSVQVDAFGGAAAFQENVRLEYQRNTERYEFLKWGQKSFRNFRVVPPGTGIVHQVNLEYLGRVVETRAAEGGEAAFPDTLIGTDSHTTMINALGIVGWGVGGIEAEAAMLGQPISMLIPDVVGFKLHGKLPEGTTATDLVLAVTQILRKKGVVGKFVEFFGRGLSHLTLPDRATIANMAPEYGATIGFFPVDAETLSYLHLTGREALVDCVRTYAETQGLFRTDQTPDPMFTETLELDLSTVVPSVAGPRRPQDRVALSEAKQSFETALPSLSKRAKTDGAGEAAVKKPANQNGLQDGSVVIAAITSCTNTSNPGVLIEAGILAKKAAALGLSRKPWVKTSLAPGSKVVVDYLEDAGLMKPLESVGFYLVGYGCTTCIGNSGPLPEEIEKTIKADELVVASVLSGNRNFEGRIHPLVRANYLMSPPLVVAYALAGDMNVDIAREPLGRTKDGRAVYLKDIWPTRAEVQEAIGRYVKAELFHKEYAKVFEGDEAWRRIPAGSAERYGWKRDSTYIRRAAFLEKLPKKPGGIVDIQGARVLALLGDSVTTDHISPAGSIAEATPAGKYLVEHGVSKKDFNSYGARRGNHEVMMRGTFANGRLKNLLVPGTEGGFTRKFPEGQTTSIYDAAVAYGREKTPLMIIAGKEYGSGSSRDWAAKGTAMLGVRAVIAESFERIHRSNLVMMGVLPLQFLEGENAGALGLTGDEIYEISRIDKSLGPKEIWKVRASRDGQTKEFSVVLRIDTPKEIDYYRHGGILPFVLRQILSGD